MDPSGEGLKDGAGSMSSMQDVPSAIYINPPEPVSPSEPAARNNLQTPTTATIGESLGKEERGWRKVIRNFTPS